MRATFSVTRALAALALISAFGLTSHERANAQAPPGASAAAGAHGANAAERSADEKAIKGVIQAFLDTRDKNDEAGLGALLTPDVDQQQTSGAMRHGREAVVKGSLSTQRETGGTRTITVDSLRFISSDVAIADGRYDSLGRADGTDQHMLTSMVLHREAGGWKIAAIRNMRPPAAAH